MSRASAAQETRTEEYRRRADKADYHAEQVFDSVAQQAWYNVALYWREMASLAERNEW